ncbi:MAG TPA: hypothetical protein VFZ93_09795 [Albitalea sp.]
MKPQQHLDMQRSPAGLIDGYHLPPLAPAPSLAARRRLVDRHAQPVATPPARMPMSFTEADKYRWILANRGSFDLLDALRDARSDAEFDAMIESAMRMSVASPSYFGDLGTV